MAKKLQQVNTRSVDKSFTWLLLKGMEITFLVGSLLVAFFGSYDVGAVFLLLLALYLNVINKGVQE